jgi:large conductance mechanosensitive channel
MKKFFTEFKVFIKKGSVLDLAVAVVIGAAFKEIITSLVKDIITPVLSLILGEDGFANYKYVIREANLEAGITENAIYYGNFIQSIIDFLIVAFVVFFVIHLITKIKHRINEDEILLQKQLDEEKKRLEEEKKKLEAQSPKTEDLLKDIKDLLSERLK